MLERFKIIALCILAAIVYGIIHDQITARICLEYFTVFHPPIFHHTHSATLLGLGWGVIATWWVGFFLGVPLAMCATEGKLPKISARQLIKPIAILLVILGAAAALTGTIGYFLARSGIYKISPDNAEYLPKSHINAFVADSFTHLASYGFGALFGVILCVWVLVKRWKRNTLPATPAAGEPPAPTQSNSNENTSRKSSDDPAPQ